MISMFIKSDDNKKYFELVVESQERIFFRNEVGQALPIKSEEIYKLLQNYFELHY